MRLRHDDRLPIFQTDGSTDERTKFFSLYTLQEKKKEREREKRIATTTTTTTPITTCMSAWIQKRERGRKNPFPFSHVHRWGYWKNGWIITMRKRWIMKSGSISLVNTRIRQRKDYRLIRLWMRSLRVLWLVIWRDHFLFMTLRRSFRYSV